MLGCDKLTEALKLHQKLFPLCCETLRPTLYFIVSHLFQQRFYLYLQIYIVFYAHTAYLPFNSIQVYVESRQNGVCEENNKRREALTWQKPILIRQMINRVKDNGL